MPFDHLIDKPIESAEFDILGFEGLAQTYVSAIQSQPNHSSLTLGLDGPWGSGKSSILKLIKDSIGQPNEGAIGTVVVSFSPWLVTNRTALVSAFFAQLSEAIAKAEKRVPRNWFTLKKTSKRALAGARKQLNGFSKVAAVVSTATSVVDPTMISGVAAGGTKAIEKLTDKSGKPGKTLETSKQELTDALSNIVISDPSFRILVLIDDLDRLDPADAVEVLRLVKAVGDFPATTYLLAYDRKAIADAIEHSVKMDDGDAYLEKIIQFSFKVPPLEPFQLRNWLRKELDELFPGEIDHSSTRASAVLDGWAGRLLKTPRDVKRLLFAVRAIWARLDGRADLLDLVWLQLLAQKAADKNANLYSWLVGYLQGLEAVAIGGNVSGTEKERQSLVEILKEIGWTEYDHGNGSSSIDFHHLDKLLAGVTANHLSTSDNDWTYKVTEIELQEYRAKKRLASPWHWRLYFALDAPSHAVTDDEWHVILESADKSTETLTETLNKFLDIRSISRPDAADQIIGRANHLLVNNELKHVERWLIAFVRLGKELEGKSKSDKFFGFSKQFEYNMRGFAKGAFKHLSGRIRKDTISAIFDDKLTTFPSADLLRDQFHKSQKAGFERDENFYLTDTELKAVIDSQIAIYESLTPAEFRQLHAPYDVLFSWRDITDSNVGPSKLVEKAMIKNSDFVETLASMKVVSSSSQEGVPHLVENWLKPFLDVEKTKNRLEKLAESKTNQAAAAKELAKLWWAER